jgi:hypothetical protein
MLTGKHFEAYLAHVVLERKLPQRERIGPRSGPPRKGPARDEEYKAWIREHPCYACGKRAPSEAAHTGTDGGLSMKASDYSCIPLCSDCHTQAPYAYHRIGKRRFEQHFGVDCAGLAVALQCKWKARRSQARPDLNDVEVA